MSCKDTEIGINDEGLDDRDWLRKGKAVVEDYRVGLMEKYVDGMTSGFANAENSQRGRYGVKQKEHTDYTCRPPQIVEHIASSNQDSDFWRTMF